MKEIISLLTDRRAAGSTPGARSDGRFVALVIEGGAMRGVVSAGMVAALEQMGLRSSFDAIYGSSAGAIAGAYFAAGQATYGTTMFYEDLNNTLFIDLKRLLFGKPVVSLEYLFEDVCTSRKPLSFENLRASGIELNAVAASISLQKAVSFNDFQTREELLTVLKASSRIPFFAGPPVSFRDDTFLDASLYESIPYLTALADPRVTDIVVLLTRPRGTYRSEPNPVDRWIVAPYLGRMSPVLQQHYMERAEEYKHELVELDSLASHGNDKGQNALVIQVPPDGVNVGSLEKRRDVLVQGALSGFRAVVEVFDDTPRHYLETIGTYPSLVTVR